ncbi:MAG: cation transporter [bacterium]
MNEVALYKRAFSLAILTIICSTLEGSFSVYYGYSSNSLTLFGNGVVSYIEVISGIGIAGMLVRLRKNTEGDATSFERTALRITGIGLYALAYGLVFMSIMNALKHEHPSTTISGIIIAIVTICIIGALTISKMKVGKSLNSPALIADAICTKLCVYMSTAVLVSSLVFEATHFEYADSIGAIVLAYFANKEAGECFKF